MTVDDKTQSDTVAKLHAYPWKCAHFERNAKLIDELEARISRAVQEKGWIAYS